MSPRFEEVVVFGVTSIVVALFAWIYTRDRQKLVALWMLGWVAILIHFAAPAVNDLIPWLVRYTGWIKVVTLIVAGTCFLLSVSEVFVNRYRRTAFALLISGAAAVYTTALFLHVGAAWFFASLLVLSCMYGAIEAVHFYGWRSLHLYSVLLLLPYGLWAAREALLGHPAHGLNFYLFGFFYITGLVYFRHFRRFTPGVIFTSVSFIAWGSVFPIGSLLAVRHIGPGPASFFWDLPKFFVAFGMIFTLFENQTEVANTVARQYQVLFEDNLAGVYVSTFEGKLLNCNGAFLRMYGLNSKEEAMSQPVDSLYSHPSERDQFLDDLGRQGQIVNYECTQRRKDGTLFWILERAIIIPCANGERVIEGTAIDITERKQHEM